MALTCKSKTLAIALLRLKQRLAGGAFVEIMVCVGHMVRPWWCCTSDKSASTGNGRPYWWLDRRSAQAIRPRRRGQACCPSQILDSPCRTRRTQPRPSLPHHNESAGAETDRGSVKQLPLILRRQVSNADKGTRHTDPQQRQGNWQGAAGGEHRRQRGSCPLRIWVGRRHGPSRVTESDEFLFCIVISELYTL